MKRILNCIIICLLGTVLNAQNWIQSSGISEKIVRTMIIYNSDTLLAGVDNEGIYISYDNGTNWEQFALNGESIYSLIKVDSNIIAGTYGNDLYKSTLTNVQWENITIDDLVINKLTLHNDTLFACTYGLSGPGAIYFSADTGATWAQFATTPPYAYLDIDFNSQGRAYVATPFGAYFSDNQSTWVKTTGFGSTVRTVNFIGNDSLIYGDDMGIYSSSDNGVSGQELSGISAGTVHFLNDTFYVATSSSGLYCSNNIGSNWTNLNMNKYVLSLLKVDGKLIAGTSEGVFVLSNTPTNIYDNKTISNNIQLYPNPVTDILHINNNGAVVRSVDIYNTSGKLIIRITDKNEVNVSGLETGIYFYKIYSQNDNSQTGKLIKE
ncbi:MAG: T9SS type A sorting domain-containing protein [Bacteroidales bacterium]|jgi:hypothetical protein|nr:T9SS type A sorting domain-containing protein [Bacteroidales bacterium]